jgi:predicted transcriptional regulator of viral defense system
VAHDFNNMLGAILGYTELALDQVNRDLPLAAYLQEIRQTILDSQLRVFSTRDLGSLLNLTPRLTLYYLQKGIKDRLFLRLKNGLYTLATDPARIEEIANRLYAPSYLSFEFALSYYNLIPETIYSVTSATPKTTREYEVSGIVYSYTTIPSAAYSGYIPLTQDYRSYLIADPEKAVADYLYLLSLGRRGRYERLDISKLDHKKIMQYLSLFTRPSLYKIFKEFKESNVLSIIS